MQGAGSFEPFRVPCALCGNRFTSLILHLSLGRLGTTKHTNDTIALFIFRPHLSVLSSSLIASCSAPPAAPRSGSRSSPVPDLLFPFLLSPAASPLPPREDQGEGLRQPFRALIFLFFLWPSSWEIRAFLSQDAVRNESGSSQDYTRLEEWIGRIQGTRSDGRNVDGNTEKANPCLVRVQSVAAHPACDLLSF